jgi:hypothetical protein
VPSLNIPLNSSIFGSLKKMGEYIEPSVTSWVDAELAKPNNDGWSDSVVLPLLSGASHEQVLALSWVLFLSRGTVQSEDGGFSWNAGGETHGGLLVDIIESKGDYLEDVLKNMGVLGQFSEELSDTLLFRNASPRSEVGKMNRVIFVSY